MNKLVLFMLLSGGCFSIINFFNVDKTSPNIEVHSNTSFCADSILDCGSLVSLEFELQGDCFYDSPDAQDIFTLTVEVDIDTDNTIDLTLLDTQLQQNGLVFSAQIELPAGDHQFVISAVDSCGEMIATQWDVMAGRDCVLPPYPSCMQEITVTFDSVYVGTDSFFYGAILTVEDVLLNTIEDTDFCNAGNLTFGLGNILYAPMIIGQSIKLDCADYLVDFYLPLNLQLFVFDDAGNYNYCGLDITMMSGELNCEEVGVGYLTGSIETTHNGPVNNADVELKDQDGNTMYTTTDDGGFLFTDLAVADTHEIRPFYNSGHGNGVSTFDIVLISQHILGVVPLSSPYKMIAADVNNSQSITVLDIIRLRKIILSIDIPSGESSWVFVDAGYIFPDPTDPWVEEYPTTIIVEGAYISGWGSGPGLTTNEFVAIKLGDVNDDADPDLE